MCFILLCRAQVLFRLLLKTILKKLNISNLQQPRNVTGIILLLHLARRENLSQFSVTIERLLGDFAAAKSLSQAADAKSRRPKVYRRLRGKRCPSIIRCRIRTRWIYTGLCIARGDVFHPARYLVFRRNKIGPATYFFRSREIKDS